MQIADPCRVDPEHLSQDRDRRTQDRERLAAVHLASREREEDEWVGRIVKTEKRSSVYGVHIRKPGQRRAPDKPREGWKPEEPKVEAWRLEIPVNIRPETAGIVAQKFLDYLRADYKGTEKKGIEKNKQSYRTRCCIVEQIAGLMRQEKANVRSDSGDVSVCLRKLPRLGLAHGLMNLFSILASPAEVASMARLRGVSTRSVRKSLIRPAVLELTFDDDKRRSAIWKAAFGEDGRSGPIPDHIGMTRWNRRRFERPGEAPSYDGAVDTVFNLLDDPADWKELSRVCQKPELLRGPKWKVRAIIAARNEERSAWRREKAGEVSYGEQQFAKATPTLMLDDPALAAETPNWKPDPESSIPEVQAIAEASKAEQKMLSQAKAAKACAVVVDLKQKASEIFRNPAGLTVSKGSLTKRLKEREAAILVEQGVIESEEQFETYKRARKLVNARPVQATCPACGSRAKWSKPKPGAPSACVSCSALRPSCRTCGGFDPSPSGISCPSCLPRDSMPQGRRPSRIAAGVLREADELQSPQDATHRRRIVDAHALDGDDEDDFRPPAKIAAVVSSSESVPCDGGRSDDMGRVSSFKITY